MCSRDTYVTFFRVDWFYRRWIIVCHDWSMCAYSSYTFYRLQFRSLTKDIEVYTTTYNRIPVFTLLLLIESRILPAISWLSSPLVRLSMFQSIILWLDSERQRSKFQTKACTYEPKRFSLSVENLVRFHQCSRNVEGTAFSRVLLFREIEGNKRAPTGFSKQNESAPNSYRKLSFFDHALRLFLCIYEFVIV